MTPDSPEVVALREMIGFLKLIVYAEAGCIAAICAFFVAWIRTLYDSRLTDETGRLEKSDSLLERVLKAVADLQAVLLIIRSKTGG